MVWTAPRTWVPGEMATAALLNQQLRDNLLASETAVVTTVEDLVVGTGPNALTRQAGITTGEMVTVVAGAIGTSPPILPPGAIAWFNGTECPTGWTEVTELRGRTPVGVPVGGTLAGATGAALANLGTRAITAAPSHTHGISGLSAASDGGHGHDVQYGAGWGSGPGYPSTNTWPNIPTSVAGAHSHSGASGQTDSAGVASIDVTMPYLQLLACRAN